MLCSCLLCAQTKTDMGCWLFYTQFLQYRNFFCSNISLSIESLTGSEEPPGPKAKRNNTVTKAQSQGKPHVCVTLRDNLTGKTGLKILPIPEEKCLTFL